MKQKTIILLFLILNIGITGSLKAQQVARSVDDYCIPGGDCSYGDGFVDFIFAGIENLDSGCSPDGYGDFTNLQGTAEIGLAYIAGIKSGYDEQFISMWIDFNDDEVFDDSERILTDFEITDYINIHEVEITIPGNGLPGIHRMRIGANWQDPSSPDPCAILTFGEWEDYMIEITGSSISYNAMAVSVDMPTIVLPGDIIPLATVANNGVEIISFPVTFTDPTTGYSSTVEVVDLGTGQTIQIEFETWSLTLGNFNVDVCTELDGDELSDDNCKLHNIICSDEPRQKLVLELFTGTW